MTTIETKVERIEKKENTTSIELKLKVGNVFIRDGREEFVREVFPDNEGEIIRFRTLRRDGQGVIFESAYSIDEKMGEHQDFSGVYRNYRIFVYVSGKEIHIYPASERYSELNKILEAEEQKQKK